MLNLVHLVGAVAWNETFVHVVPVALFGLVSHGGGGDVIKPVRQPFGDRLRLASRGACRALLPLALQPLDSGISVVVSVGYRQSPSGRILCREASPASPDHRVCHGRGGWLTGQRRLHFAPYSLAGARPSSCDHYRAGCRVVVLAGVTAGHCTFKKTLAWCRTMILLGASSWSSATQARH